MSAPDDVPPRGGPPDSNTIAATDTAEGDDVRRGKSLLRRLSAVTLVTVLGGALVSGPALAEQAQRPPAGRKCADPGERIADLPWHQSSLDPAKVNQLSDGRSVTVAVIDSGVDSGHPQLAGRVRPGRDLLFPGGGPGDFDCIGHGTAVASIIAGGGEEDDRVEQRPHRAEERRRVLDLELLANEVHEDLAVPPQLAEAGAGPQVGCLGRAFDHGRRGDGERLLS